MVKRIKPRLPEIEIDGPKSNLKGIAPPTINDDETEGYSKGSLWLDRISLLAYFCFDAQEGAAKWSRAVQENGVPENGIPVDFTENFEINWFINNPFTTIIKDNFETDWQDPGTYILQIAESFETGWFDDNLYNLLLSDNFEINWFDDNLYNLLLSDNFEINWFINNPFARIYLEDFENGGY